MEFQINTTEDLINFIEAYGTNENICKMVEVANAFLPKDKIILELFFTDTDNINILVNQIKNLDKPFDIKTYYCD